MLVGFLTRQPVLVQHAWLMLSSAAGLSTDAAQKLLWSTARVTSRSKILGSIIRGLHSGCNLLAVNYTSCSVFTFTGSCCGADAAAQGVGAVGARAADVARGGPHLRRSPQGHRLGPPARLVPRAAGKLPHHLAGASLAAPSASLLTLSMQLTLLSADKSSWTVGVSVDMKDAA